MCCKALRRDLLGNTQEEQLVLNLVVPGPPAIGFTVTGSGFAPGAWVWITVEDLTDDTRPVNGPDAFQPAADGTFTRNDETTRLSCGHAFRAEAFVDNQVVATSEPVMPDCPTKVLAVAASGRDTSPTWDAPADAGNPATFVRSYCAAANVDAGARGRRPWVSAAGSGRASRSGAAGFLQIDPAAVSAAARPKCAGS